MNTVILDQIPFEVDTESLLNRLRIADKPQYAERVVELIKKAQEIAKPKAMYREAYIEEKGENFVLVEGIKLTSRVLRVNLEDTYKIYPFIATSGTELEEWSHSITEMLENFWADAIKQAALDSARKALDKHFKEHSYGGSVSKMNPGSLENWPIKEQANLFALLGDTKKLIGVELLETYLMAPVKTVSGFFFPTESSFENCQLCPREKCPGRKAKYDSQLYSRRYVK